MPEGRLQAIFYNNPDGYPPIVNSARLLAAEGYGLDILCREYGPQWGIPYPAGVTLHRIAPPSTSSLVAYFHFVWQAWRQADRNASIFVGHDMHGFLPAYLLARRKRKPVIYHCHDFVIDNARLALGGRLVKAFEQRYARQADLVIVPDAARAAVMARALGLERPPLVVANAPLQANQASGDTLRQALARLGLQFEQVLFRQGRIGPGHALENTLRSMPHWADERWGFVVMGLVEDAYRQALRQLAQEMGAAGRFVILPPVAYDQVAAYTPAAAAGHALYDPIHVNNQHITTASNKIMEYLAAGVPLLVSDRPDLRRFVDRYHCGLAADESSPASIAQAVNQLLGDPAGARQMGAAGQRAFQAEYCYPRQFQPVLDWLRLQENR